MIENDPEIIHLPSLEHPDAWESPALFDEIDTPEIPASFLPDCIGKFASELALATETPDALALMTILGVVSACASKRFVVCPKEGWRESVNIYTLVALPPANNKSAIMKACLKPLIDWEKEQEAILQVKIRQQCSERKTQEKIIESLRLKAAKETNSIEQKNFIREIADREAALIEPEVLPILFANDATPESLAQSVSEQNGRFAIFSDEGGVLETLGGLYTNGTANIDILLKGTDGGDVRIKRKDKSYNHLNPYLTLVLAVQPLIIRNMSQKRIYTGNGMLERFLYVLPKSKLGYRTHDKPPVSEEVKNAYNNKIKSLLVIPPLSEHGQQKPYKLTLKISALEAWREFQREIENDLKPDGRLSACQGWGGKICGFTLRIAGLLHIAEYSYQQLVINEKTMIQAIQIALLLIDHAIAAYGLMGTDQISHDAKEVFKWLRASGKLSVTKSELTYAMRRKINGERLNKAIATLIDRNIISEPQKLPTRKPTTVFHINPEIMSV